MIDIAKKELQEVSQLVKTGNPTIILEKAVELSALLASVNEATALLEHAYTIEVAKYREAEENAATARIRAQAGIQYRDYKIAKGVGESLESTITSLRRYAEQLAKEMFMPKENILC